MFPNVEDLNSRGEFLIKDTRSMNIKNLKVDNGKLILLPKKKTSFIRKYWVEILIITNILLLWIKNLLS